MGFDEWFYPISPQPTCSISSCVSILCIPNSYETSIVKWLTEVWTQLCLHKHALPLWWCMWVWVWLLDVHFCWSELQCSTCTTFSNGCLGSHNDEERSEMRYVMRIAKPRESSKLWTHIALPGYAWKHTYLSVRAPHSTLFFVCVFTWSVVVGFCLCRNEFPALVELENWRRKEVAACVLGLC